MPTTLRGFLTVVFLFSINLFFAQQKTISGTVTDNFDQPLPGANIVVQGTTRGTTANFEGYYEIRASEGETLAISYIGYLTQTLVIGPGFTFDVSLEPGNNLDEVIVVGYGTTTRRELTDNITSVGAEQIKEIPVPSIQGALVGKVGSVFASSATQHGGQESTILSFHISLLHHGFVIVGLPYAFQGQMRIDEISGGSPYGASTIAGGDGSRMTSENELEAARFQGKHVAEIASKLAK